ncbi:hypothetical protein SASPL_142804 [Salvia splendens]|uniref:Amino acid transporter transmembrane domain-containing protein n=1 Tax=Salvia splendens TaxID=180675 RepID=A0A8X8WLI7_SALSN|nr:hypothetical protein SASPL_142804 [Salvia splendens]
MFAVMVSTSPPQPKEAPYSEKSGENHRVRQAKWWYSTFHTVTAMIGAGVLSLPYAMAYLGWQLIQLHECVPGVRFDRYYDLGRHAFGQRLGKWIVLPQQLIVQVGCNVMPDINSISGVSLAAAIMSLSYSTIAWVGSLSQGRAPDVSYEYKKTSDVDSMFRVFNALGQITTPFAGHAVILEIQSTIPSAPEKPSSIAMWRGAVWAYFVNAICYFPVALVGYWAFGQDVADNVLVALEKPAWLIAAANLMVFVHVIGSYQIYAMPFFEVVEKTLVARFKVTHGLGLRIFVRSTYVAFTTFVAVTFPFFGDLLGLFGGFGFSSTTYILPCIIWLKIKKPQRFSLSWTFNWGCIFFGVSILFTSTIGGVRNVVVDSSTYDFYS